MSEKKPKDDRLEALSDRVRKGISISMSEAMEVIEYQGKLRRYRKEHPWWKFGL